MLKILTSFAGSFISYNFDKNQATFGPTHAVFISIGVMESAVLSLYVEGGKHMKQQSNDSMKYFNRLNSARRRPKRFAPNLFAQSL